MADISSLGTMQPVEPLDLINYKDNQEVQALPRAGRYTVQAPDSFPSSSFGRTQAGMLSAQIDPTITGPSAEGYKLRFVKVSAKTYKRGTSTVSQFGDYLRACGIRAVLTDEQALADAVEQTANRTYEVIVDWRAYNKNTKFSVEGMDRFPSDGNGGHLPFIEDPNDFEVDPDTGETKKDENNKPIHKRLRANLSITRFIPANS